LRRAITISGKTSFSRYYYYAVNGVLTNGQLTHVAFAYNGVTATTLIDGVVRSNVVSASVNNSAGNYTPRNNVFGISEIGDYHLNRINAMFDNVRIYKRALTASEMTVIYNAEKP
jgi:hypothetical protein